MNIIKKIESGEKIKIAFLGDSITQGCFEGDSVPEDENMFTIAELLKG